VYVTNRERVERIQFRVCVVLKHWLERQLFDFDKDLIAELSEFIDQLFQHSNKVHPSNAVLLSQFLTPRPCVLRPFGSRPILCGDRARSRYV